jgi:hypothetical protein
MSIVNTAIIDQGGSNYLHEILLVAAGKQYVVTTILVCNTYNPLGASPEAQTSIFDMHLVPSGQGIATSTTTVVRQLALPAGETFTFDSEKIVLDAGDRIIIEGQLPANLAATVSYLEVL